MKHVKRVSVAKAQQVNIDLSDPLNLLAWVGSMVWFIKEFRDF
jgi:hypothetical protein